MECADNARETADRDLGEPGLRAYAGPPEAGAREDLWFGLSRVRIVAFAPVASRGGDAELT